MASSNVNTYEHISPSVPTQSRCLSLIYCFSEPTSGARTRTRVVDRLSYNIESKHGNRTQFKRMVDECRAAGVKVITGTSPRSPRDVLLMNYDNNLPIDSLYRCVDTKVIVRARQGRHSASTTIPGSIPTTYASFLLHLIFEPVDIIGVLYRTSTTTAGRRTTS